MEKNFSQVCSTLAYRPKENSDCLQAGVVDKSKFWKKSTLTVQFLDGSGHQHHQVLEIAKEWSQHCNIKFIHTHHLGDIRITFNIIGDYSSRVGTDALNVPHDKHTMSLGFGDERDLDETTVLHEFGHALGLLHEHQHPRQRIPWNEEEVYKYYSGYPNYWKKEDITHNVLNRAVWAATDRLDMDSIMLYAIPGYLVHDPSWVYKRNTRLSTGDKEMVKKMYPFDVTPHHRDVFIVKKQNCPSNQTDVHIISGKAEYRANSSHFVTGLHPTNEHYEFCLATNRDLFVINKRGHSNRTELYVFGAQNHYKDIIFRTATGLHLTDEHWEFLLAPNRDLFCISKLHTGSNTTEVHVLSAESEYQRFCLQTKTALHRTNNHYVFALASNRDLFCMKLNGTGTNTTEVHVLRESDNYQSFLLQTGTGLETCDTSRNRTESRLMEFLILSAASNYHDFIMRTRTCLEETDDACKFLCL